MATQAQIDAARRNGAKSKGPVTAAGKERSAANSTTHGLSAKRILVLSNESNDGFVSFVAEMEQKFQPIDDIERAFVWRAASALWRLNRASVIETGLFDLQMCDDLKEVNAMYPQGEVDEGVRLATAFKHLSNDRSLELIGRYEARLSREYERAIRGLDRVRAERKNEQPPVEPPAQNEKLQNEPDAALPEANRVQNEPANLDQHLAQSKMQNEPEKYEAARKSPNEPKPEPDDSSLRDWPRAA